MRIFLHMPSVTAYHGSDRPITRFRPRQGTPHAGFFFSSSKECATEWARHKSGVKGGFLLTVDLAVEDQSLRVDAAGAHWSEIVNPWDDGPREIQIDDMARSAMLRGFRSVIVSNLQDAPDTKGGAAQTTYVVFNPDNIRIVLTAAVFETTPGATGFSVDGVSLPSPSLTCPHNRMKASIPSVSLADFLNGPRKVRAVETGRAFMVSAVESGGVWGVVPYEIGAERPAGGAHVLMSATERFDWFGRLALSD